MPQTNDNLLYRGLPPRTDTIAEEEVVRILAKQNTLYIQNPIVINAYKISDIIMHPQLTSVYGLASVSFVKISDTSVLISCPSCGTREANISDYIVREVNCKLIPQYTETNGINEYSQKLTNGPWLILTPEELSNRFCPLGKTVKEATFSVTNNCWLNTN